MTLMLLFRKIFLGTLCIMTPEIRDPQLLKKIATVIKNLRNEKGVSQEAVYNDINIHVGRIEMGASNMSVSTLSTICKYFKIKLSDFFKLVEAVK